MIPHLKHILSKRHATESSKIQNELTDIVGRDITQRFLIKEVE